MAEITSVWIIVLIAGSSHVDGTRVMGRVAYYTEESCLRTVQVAGAEEFVACRRMEVRR